MSYSPTTISCRAKDPATCRVHGTPVSGQDVDSCSFEEQVKANFAAREKEKEDAFKQEWKERTPDWKKLGFQYPISARKFYDYSHYVKESIEELKTLSEKDLFALKFYTTNNYNWINNFLRGKTTLAAEESDQSIYDVDLSKVNQRILQEPNQKHAAEIVSALDKILTSKNTSARVLYRGESTLGLNLSSKEELHKYVDNVYQIGSTFSVPNFLSTSDSVKTGLAYSSGRLDDKAEGILFELKTSKGLNISSVSDYSREVETLLPRNTTWKVAAVHKGKTIKTETPSVYSNKMMRGFKTATLIQLVEN